ncbi:MAG: hypothetical protein ACKPGI_19275, partial [Verrucomicrobiota bacterium]
NALGRGEEGWSDLVQLLPGCIVGTERGVHGQRPAEDLEDLGVAVRAVLEGIYTRRGNPASKLDAVSPHQLADQLESLVRQLRDMRSPEEVSLDLKEARGERAQLLEALRADCDAASRSQDPGGHDDTGSRRLQQRMGLLEDRLNALHEELERCGRWKAMVLGSLVNLDEHLCIRK